MSTLLGTRENIVGEVVSSSVGVVFDGDDDSPFSVGVKTRGSVRPGTLGWSLPWSLPFAPPSLSLRVGGLSLNPGRVTDVTLLYPVRVHEICRDLRLLGFYVGVVTYCEPSTVVREVSTTK